MFTATVSAAPPAGGTPTGSVQFFTNGIASGPAVSLVAGTATLSISSLLAGTNTIVAAYAGDGNFLSSSNSIAQIVTAAITPDLPRTLAITNNGNGTVTITFQGTPGAEYVVQASASINSGSWQNVSTNVAGSNGFWTYTEATAGHAMRFYRSAQMAQTGSRPIDTPVTRGIRDNGDGTVTVTFVGTAGNKYVVQATTTLLSPVWVNISTNTARPTGMWSFTEPKNARMKFYRAAKP
jgi:hypothetical protein